jgi:hypothetical protein
MGDWRSRLHKADRALPIGLSDDDLRRLRDRVVSAVPRGDARGLVLARPFALTAGALLLVCGGILGGLHHSIRPASGSAVRTSDGERQRPEPGGPGERQQLHFATPGGTRIIWVFDSEFKVEGTLP